MDPITDIASFVDRLIAEKGLEGLDPEVLTEVRADLSSRVEDRVNAALLAYIPQDKIAAFDEVLETGDAKAVQEFVSSSVPKADEVVAEALMKFRETYVS